MHVCGGMGRNKSWEERCATIGVTCSASLCEQHQSDSLPILLWSACLQWMTSARQTPHNP